MSFFSFLFTIFKLLGAAVVLLFLCAFMVSHNFMQPRTLAVISEVIIRGIGAVIFFVMLTFGLFGSFRKKKEA